MGAALLVLAAVAGVGLFVWTLVGFTETDTAVPADGETHTVTVPSEGDRMLWYDESRVRPECIVEDAATGESLTLRSPGGSFTRGDGSASWRAFHRFDPGSGELVVTCTSSASDAEVEIGPAPRVATLVGGILATLLVPVLLGGIGLIVLVITAVRFATGDPRTPPVRSGPS
ncbi:hypothetical protein [Nocardioides pacificus]